MARRLRLFISGTSDVEAERETIGKGLAHFPVPLGWVIKRTPNPGDQSLESLSLTITESDFFVLLMGADVQAPIGAELSLAQRTGLIPHAYLKDTAQTLAARAFVRHSGLTWSRFSTSAEAAALLIYDLSQEILDRAVALEIAPAEWQVLSDYVGRAQAGRPAAEQGAAAERGGPESATIGAGGVIMAPGREVPSGGTLVGAKENANDGNNT